MDAAKTQTGPSEKDFSEDLRRLGFTHITGLKVFEASQDMEVGDRVEAPEELLGQYIDFEIPESKTKTILITPTGRIWIREWVQDDDQVEIPHPEILAPNGIMQDTDRGSYLALLKISPQDINARKRNMHYAQS